MIYQILQLISGNAQFLCPAYFPFQDGQLRLLLFPIVTLLVFLLFPVDTIVEMTVLAAASAPCAAICTMMSLTYTRNAAYASEIFGVSTLLSVATMPLMMVIYEALSRIQ